MLAYMTDAMHDASSEARHGMPAVSPVDPWALLKDAFGVDTQQEVAERCCVDLRTLQRMIERPERSRHGNVLAVCDASGIPMEILFGRTAQMADAA